jgi:hypothetical protein
MSEAETATDGRPLDRWTAAPLCALCGDRADVIDIDIRRLVGLLNQWPGIRTLASCAGHREDAGMVTAAYVCFVAAEQREVRRLIDTIPNFGSSAAFSGFEVLVRCVWLQVGTWATPDPSALVFSLYIAGTPLHYQRAQIDAIERALLTALQSR